MLYQMQEGYFTLEGPWQDRSVNVLVPEYLKTKGANLVIARDSMPMGAGLLDYLDQQKMTFRKELTDFRLLADEAGVIDDRDAHFLEFTWKNEDKIIRQLMYVIPENEKVLSITATIPGGSDNEARKALVDTIESFKFGEITRPTEGATT